MYPLSYSGYRFPRDIIQRAVWMYLRFTLSYRRWCSEVGGGGAIG